MNIQGICRKFFSSSFTLTEQGSGFTYQLYLQKANKTISFWHDVPLKENGFYNMGIEIPKQKIAKFEVSKEIPSNPIIFDTKKNKITNQKELRYYAQFPCFNYGFLPQTWENSIKDLHEGFKGDDDPLDVVELGQKHLYQPGTILQVKILGAFCVLDQGEIDWKILALNADEAQQLKISNFSQFEAQFPGRGKQILDWFRFIKTYDGKKENSIFFDNKIFDSERAEQVVDETNIYWKELINPKEKQFEEKRKQFNL